MKKEKDIHIKVLDYGISKSSGFTFGELVRDLKLNELEKRLIWSEISGADVLARSGKYRPEQSTDYDKEITILSFESRFRHLQYTALEEARKDSRRAIFISVVTLIVTVAISLWTFHSTSRSDQVWKDSEIKILQDIMNSHL